ncbi:hypothetical protein MKX66_30325 [Bacillus sp. FSL R9-9530]|uniref:hypothetical protein n=1 Tax=Bacillus sp. FSL R9-9530 TaxID=2921593 RepID=UPI0030F84932
MKLKLTTPNGFKSEFNISLYFIISIGILVIQLHQAQGSFDPCLFSFVVFYS